MSIINDALKRAKDKQQSSLSSLSQVLSGTNNTKRRRLIWISAALICLAGVFLVRLVNRRSNSPVQAMLSGTSPGAYYLREADIEIPFQSPRFRLSGILYDNQSPLAIINERVVREGAVVNGAELLEIRPNYVKLALEGKEVRLRVK
ncbi:MAG: hypothetical protein HQ595_04390 [Candidatus Omnitrophica bacterium]|nr:hypothetical protein [Candidatus Omnitrophota bacterium]